MDFILCLTLLICCYASYKLFKKIISIVPLSVNYFIHRQCNYSCKFCFHTAKSSFKLPLEVSKRGLKLLKDAGMKKINFSGGEPFIQATLLGELVQFCKKELKLESVTIVSNGSLITEDWFQKYAEYLDIIAISCDSFNKVTLKKIGRNQDGKDHIKQLNQIKVWCQKYKVLFKINTVVNSCNVDEDMNNQIAQLQPYRWKVFQCLLIEGENFGKQALKDASEMVISDQQFKTFVSRHLLQNPIPEDNSTMKDSYLNLDEQMRFLNCQQGKKEPTLSILDVGVEKAIKFSGFDKKQFFKRGGKFKWSKNTVLDW